MRPYRTLLAAAAVVCASLAVPATASTGTWLEGTTSGWVDFTVKTEQTIRNATITATGRYGGYYLTRRDRGLTSFGMLVVENMPKTPFPIGDNLTSDERLEPGTTYRLYLIADGLTLVQFPGLRVDKKLKPKHRVRSALSSAPLVKTGGAWQRTTPISVNDTIAVSLLFARSSTWFLAKGTSCIVRAENADAGCGSDGGSGIPASGSDVPHRAVDSYRYWPDLVRPWPLTDRYVAIQRLTHPLDDVTSATGMAFSLSMR